MSPRSAASFVHVQAIEMGSKVQIQDVIVKKEDLYIDIYYTFLCVLPFDSSTNQII